MTTTNVLVAGKQIVIAGYGFCGKGLAAKARGLGAQVIVTEIDPRSALQAHMDGHRVMTMEEAAPFGDLFITTTGNTSVITARHFRIMKDGAICCNAGHFNVEVDVKWLEANAGTIIRREGIDTYVIDSRHIHVLAEGRLVNLATPKGMGHPVEVMDLSFALQALCTRHIVQHGRTRPAGVLEVPREIDERVAREKLATLGLSIDSLTPDQIGYMQSWEMGT
jgi:adenosylhomocysteinase